MRLFLLLVCLTLLTATGCIFWGGRDGDRRHDEHSAGVDHGEHPGDLIMATPSSADRLG